MSDLAKRLHTLLTDRACEGLDESLEAELIHLLAGAEIDPSYEQAAAGIELALLPHDEPLPAALTATLFAQADDYWRVSPAPAPAQAGQPVSGTTQTGYMPADLRREAEAVGGPAHWTGPQPRITAAIEDQRGTESASSDDDDHDDHAERTGKAKRKRKPEVDPGDSLEASRTSRVEPRRSSSAAHWAAYASAFAAVVVLAIALWLFMQQRQQVRAEDPAAIRAQLDTVDDEFEWTFVPTEDPALGSDASGSLVWSSDLQSGVLTLQGLAVNEPTDAQYQLWIADETREGPPVDGGVFDVTAKDELEIAIDAKLLIGRPTMFTITVERPGGVVVSDQERVVMRAAAP
jgi:anti-sigma-K factor RskA